MFRVVSVHGIEFEDKEYGKEPIAQTPDMSVKQDAPKLDRADIIAQLKEKGIDFKPQMKTEKLQELLTQAEEEL